MHMLAHSSLVHLASIPLILALLGFGVGLFLGFVTWYYGWGTDLVERFAPELVRKDEPFRHRKRR